MLDGLLGRGGFSSKCKSLIKPTRTRIEVLRRRAEAKQRFLKEDLAKLLANGLDVNAYGRTEEFIAGLNLLSCYTFIDQSCEFILKQLSIMQKLGQCPEECRETVASLMFAAARFSDLPELRDLRDVFQDRYGNGLECFVNQVFVEKIASKPPVAEKRIKLLQDIAAEFSIQWDSKGFKQRMDKPSTLAQDQTKKPVSLSVTDDKYKVPSGNNVFHKNNQRFKERIEHVQEGPTLDSDGNANIRKKEELNIPFVKREEKHSKDRRELAHKEQVLHHYGNGNENGNGNDRRKEELNIPYVRREEKRSKERIEHDHEGRVLHHNGNGYGNRVVNGNANRDVNGNGNGIPFVGREEKHSKERIHHNGNGNGIPFVGRNEKRGYKHEELTNKPENAAGYFSKSRQESDSEKNGFGKHDTPVMIKNSVFDDDNVNRGRKERHNYKQDPLTNREKAIETIDNNDNLFFGRHEMKSPRRSRDRRLEVSDNDRVTTFPKVEKPDLYGKSESVSNGIKYPVNSNKEDDIKSTGKVKEEEPIRSKSSLPPPYVKLNIPPPYSKPHNASNSDKINKEYDHMILREDRNYQNNIPLPKPRSIRRKHSKSSSSHDDIGSSEDAPRVVKRISSSRRKERKGLQILFDDEHYHNHHSHRGDDEEKMMDKLLLHYSKKPSAYDISKLRKKKSKSPHHRSEDEVAEMIVPPIRSLSLPNEHSGESEPMKKVYARANSFQPDNQAPHVHPKLPDYDDLAARFAALRGR